MPGTKVRPLGITNTTRQPVLTTQQPCPAPARGRPGQSRQSDGEGDTRPMVLQLASCGRARRANSLTTPLGLQNQMAGTPKRCWACSTNWHLQPANAKAEAAQIQDAIKADGGDFELAPGLGVLRREGARQNYDFDPEAVKPHFELNRVLNDGVSRAEPFLRRQFPRATDLPVYHPDVRVR